MTVAYVDTSCILAIAFKEPGSAAADRELRAADALVAANLLEAELRAAFVRQRADMPADLLREVTWIIPDRPLGDEIQRVLSVGHIRGADCWHLAAALFFAPQPAQLKFLTLDQRQSAAAEALGFATIG